MPVTTYCDVFSFLFRSLHAMACFFDCFGIRNINNNNHHQRRHTSTPTSNAPVVEEQARQKIRLSSLFTAEECDIGVEKEDCVVKEKDNETLVRRVGRSDFNEELVEEAKFLKACGTLPETPVEIRKRLIIVENSDMQRPQSMPYSSLQTPDESKQEETKADNLQSSDPQSFYSALESSPVTPEEAPSVDTAAEYSAKIDANKPRTVLRTPYPTPIRITDDMQTPGTVFATNMKSLTKGNGRIRSQYVHSVLNPIENLYELDELKEDNSAVDASDHECEYLSAQGNATPSHVVGLNENSANYEKLGDASLSAWLKPVSAKDDGAAKFRKPDIGRTPGDRPIIGLVAAHWNPQDEVSNISPKGWDGNGIPNSTTKYKEDQKVCWHATPFEERLEKALSDETIPQRKLIMGAPMTFEEMEGQDTATSQINSMTCPKSVVSF